MFITRFIIHNESLFRWGGVQVINLPEAVNAYKDQKQKMALVEAEVDAKKAMSVFLSQLRLLLGLQDASKTPKGVSVLPLPSDRPPLRLWERDFLLRLRAAEQLALSRSTLAALSHLLSQVRASISHYTMMTLSSIRYQIL